jgi:hypothetical protein
MGLIYKIFCYCLCLLLLNQILIMHRRAPDSTVVLSPGLGQFPSSMLFRQTSICMSAVMGSYSTGLQQKLWKV